MYARVTFTGLGSSMTENLPARVNPRAEPHRLASDYEVKWRDVWRRVEKDGNRLFVHLSAYGRCYLEIIDPARSNPPA